MDSLKAVRLYVDMHCVPRASALPMQTHSRKNGIEERGERQTGAGSM